MLDIFLLLQLVCFVTAISFSAGGGNYPGLEAGGFLYFKAGMMCLPIIAASVLFVIRPIEALSGLRAILKNNLFLWAYLATAFASIPLAVDSTYSLNRLLYTVFGTIGLFSIIIQYDAYLKGKAQEFLIRKHLAIIGFIVILFPIYIALTQPFDGLIPGFRHALQGTFLIHPNLLSSLYAHFLVWFAAFLFFGTKSKFAEAFLSAVFLALIIILFSRAVFLSLFVTAIIMGLLITAWYRKTWPIIASLICLLSVCVTTLLVLTDMIPAMDMIAFMTREGDPRSFFTLTNRTELWSQILSNLSLKTALIGHGYSVMTETFGIDFGTGILYGTHNAYLSVFLGSGIFALIFVLLYLVINMKRIYAMRYSLPPYMTIALFSSYVVFLINCIFEEEMGINTSVTFAYLVFMTNIISAMPARQGGPA